MFEVQASQLALEKRADKETRPFARKMVKDHQKTSSELKSLVEGGKVKATLPTALDSEHQKMLDDLKAKSGKDFDQSYDQIQLKAHQDAVALFEAYAKGGDDPELKKWAARTLPHLKQHLAMAQKAEIAVAAAVAGRDRLVAGVRSEVSAAPTRRPEFRRNCG